MATPFEIVYQTPAVIRSVNSSGTISTLSLTSTDPVYIDNGGFTDAFCGVVDSSGNVYLGDRGAIWKITSAGVVTRIAGTGTPGNTGDGGAATSAELNYPIAIALDANDNIYFVDQEAFVARVINQQATTQTLLNISVNSGCIARVAGTGTNGSTGDGGAAISAEIAPTGIAIDSSGNMWFSESNALFHRVREVTTNGTINTIIGSAGRGHTGDGGAYGSAELNSPFGLTFDANGNLYITDQLVATVRAVNFQNTGQTILNVSVGAGEINTVAGTPGSAGFSGDTGAATSAELNTPITSSIDSSGNLYICDLEGRVRLVNTSGIINTIAGNGTPGSTGDGGAATSAEIGGNAGGVMYVFFASPGPNPVNAIIAETQLDSPGSSSASEFVRFRLRNFAGSVPQASGNPVTITATLDVSSTISQQLWPNSAISPSGTFYTIETWCDGRITGSINAYLNTSQDLSNVTPI